MGKIRKQTRRQQELSRRIEKPEYTPSYSSTVVKSLTGKNAEQKAYINSIKNFTVTVGIGEPGTGKTFVASVLAAQELMNPSSNIESILMIRPNEPLGRTNGYLPGSLAEKLEPWLEPIADGIKWATSDSTYKHLITQEKIKYLAVEHMRGRSFNNVFVIVDEAQNIGIEAMKCLVTRIGKDSKLVICGDTEQKDIKSDSGLQLLLDIQEQYEYYPFNLVELLENVRSEESSAFQAIFKDMNLI